MAIGYGATYPAVANAIEKYEVVTITTVGKPGTQAWLSMDAKAGETNIKVSSVGNISVGDKIRLDIASEGHGIEIVTVTKVGTQSVRSTFNGPLKENEDPGTGLDLAEPLKFNHASNMPFAQGERESLSNRQQISLTQAMSLSCSQHQYYSRSATYQRS